MGECHAQIINKIHRSVTHLSGSSPLHDLVTSFPGHLENSDSLSNENSDFQMLTDFIIHDKKIPHLLMTLLTPLEKSFRVRKWSSLQWQAHSFQNYIFA